MTPEHRNRIARSLLRDIDLARDVRDQAATLAPVEFEKALDAFERLETDIVVSMMACGIIDTGLPAKPKNRAK